MYLYDIRYLFQYFQQEFFSAFFFYKYTGYWNNLRDWFQKLKSRLLKSLKYKKKNRENMPLFNSNWNIYIIYRPVQYKPKNRLLVCIKPWRCVIKCSRIVWSLWDRFVKCEIFLPHTVYFYAALNLKQTVPAVGKCEW